MEYESMIAIDTNALIWWVEGDNQLSKKAKNYLDSTIENINSVIVSSMTILEIATLIDKSRLALSMDLETWVDEIQSIPSVTIENIDVYTAIHSRRLPEPFHKDPADRTIVALARKHGIPLITSDGKIQNYEHVETLW